jgi:hypothetical protein
MDSVYPPKRRALFELHGVKTQQTVLFIVIAPITSNPVKFDA